MRKIILLLILAQMSLLQYGQVIADHTVVDKYDQIPQYYIDKVKKMLVTVAGMSHSKGYYNGAVLLESLDPRFAVYTSLDVEPLPLYTDVNLRLCRPWMTGETIWTSQAGIDAAKTSQIRYAANNPYDAYIFGWSYQATWTDPPGGTIDPVYNVHWAGQTDGGIDGSKRWGLDAGDIALTGNRVNMDTYLDAWEQFITYCDQNYPTTKMVFSTLIVDSHAGTEAGFQRELKSQHIRNYINGKSGKYLFDFGDILAHNNSGEAFFANWNDNGTIRPHPQIHPENLMDYDESWNIISSVDADGDHIGEVGALRVAKALWWMLARMAGWDGNSILNGLSDLERSGKTPESRVAYDHLTNSIQINCSDKFANGHLGLYNLHGYLLKSNTIESNSNIINTSLLPSGLYIVVLSKNNYKEANKIVLFH